MESGRDFQYTEEDFQCIQKLVNHHTGITLSDAKQDMVYSRLSRRLRQLNLGDFKSYCELLRSGDSEDELIQFVNSITTNLTSFFREEHHFDYLAGTLFPRLLAEKRAEKRVRVWSAGCSTGEEPYSLSMVVRECFPDDWDVKILATDLDSNVIAKGSNGIYQQERVEGISGERLGRWFRKGKGGLQGQVRVSPALQEIITFKQLNLMNKWPMRGPFDIIFCRNVVIYFDKPTQKVLFGRFAELMTGDSCLFIGHSESLFKVTDRFKLLGQTIYRRVS